MKAPFAYALPPDAVSIHRRILGLVLLVICVAASMLLVLQHFGVIGLPGCGPDSRCMAAVTGRWGSILGWPVSFVGLAYFAALAAAWTVTTGSGVSMLFGAAVRLGVVASLAYLSIMYAERTLCVYCIVIHLANLIFWIIVERSPRATASAPAAIITVVAGFALVSALLNVAVSEQRRLAAERAGRAAYRSIEVAEVESGALPPISSGNAEPAADSVPELDIVPAADTELMKTEPAAPAAGPDANDSQHEMPEASADGSQKKAPSSAQDDAEPPPDPVPEPDSASPAAADTELMKAEPPAPVEGSDAADKQHEKPAASADGSQEKASSSDQPDNVPPPDPGADSEADSDGPGEAEKAEQQASPADGRDGQTARQPYRIGPDQAEVRMTVFYDYQAAQCWRIDRDIQNLLVKYGDAMSVTARHYPLCSDCNFSVASNTHPNACRAALAAEAAGLLKGNDGFWDMHRWLLAQRGNFTDDELKEGLVTLGYDDVDQFLETMNSPTVLGAVLADIVEAQSRKIAGTPTVFMNGRRLGGVQSEKSIIQAVAAVVDNSRPDATSDQEPLPPASPTDETITDTFTEQLQLAASASTVRIVNTAGQSLGSGTIIALRDPFVYVLTAYHLVPEVKRVEIRTYSKESYPKPAGIYSYATVVASSESADLAVIRIATRDPMPEPLPIVPLELVPRESGLPVLTVGYDGEESAPSCVATEVIDTKRVRRTADDAAVMVWEVAQESAAGRSGGPLIDQRGFVLGVASGISEGKAYFAHAEEIHRFLERNGLQGLVAQKQSGLKK